jgi:hypothetical protein
MRLGFKGLNEGCAIFIIDERLSVSPEGLSSMTLKINGDFLRNAYGVKVNTARQMAVGRCPRVRKLP